MVANMAELLIDTGFINRFDDKIRNFLQQSESKLKSKVNSVPINSEYLFIDKVGKVNVRKDNSAYAAISDFEPSYGRRRLSADRFLFDMKFDKNAMNKMVNDSAYQSDVVNQMKAAFERKMDKVIYNSLDASVYTGKAGGTPITASTDGVVTIDATAGTTYEKLREAKRQLASKGWSIQNGYQVFHVITEEELDSYESELEMTSSLYTGNNAVQRDSYGQITGALGIQFIVFASDPDESSLDPAMLDVDSTTRKCFFFVGKSGQMGFPGAVTLGMERTLTWEFVKDPHAHDTWILKGAMNMGAVREHGSSVVQYNTTTL